MKTGWWNRSGFLVGALFAVGGGVAAAQAPVVGTQPIGMSVQEEAVVAKGWSSRRDLLGKPLYNDKNEKVGNIEDVIIGPDRSASFAIVGTGGFVGLDRHDVAIPFAQLQPKGTRMVLPGATKEAIKALPEFQFAR